VAIFAAGRAWVRRIALRQTRLILFDIDGTLTRSHNGFIPFNEAILKTFGFPGDIRTVVPDGNTDPQILDEIFAAAHQEVEITEEKWHHFGQNLNQSYSRALQEQRTVVQPLPGALELVQALATSEEFHQGVVTGNLEVVARLKLTAAGLCPYLSVGAYGSDSRDRADLPGIARERWERKIGAAIAPDRRVIIGDTPKDLDAAKKNQMKCLLVGTGRYPVEDLAYFQPDGCLPDLTSTQVVIETLCQWFFRH